MRHHRPGRLTEKKAGRYGGPLGTGDTDKGPFGKWHTYTTFRPSCSESGEGIKDYAPRLFRRREGLFSLFLARVQDSLTV